MKTNKNPFDIVTLTQANVLYFYLKIVKMKHILNIRTDEFPFN